MPNNLEKHFKCRMCSSKNYNTVVTYDTWLEYAKSSCDERKIIADILLKSKNLLFGDIVACSKCELHSIKKLPNNDSLNDFYQNYYVNKEYLSKEKSKIKRAMRQICALPNFSSAKTFLDVGCNQGFAVEAANKLGLCSSGIEIDKEAIKFAQINFAHNEFICKDILSFAKEKRRFDIIYCSEVLEHVVDFLEFSKAMVACLSEEGCLFLTTPDIGHFRTPANLLCWSEIKPPEHITWFQKKHLKKIFSQLGLKVKFQLSLKPKIKMIARNIKDVKSAIPFI